MLAQLLRAHLRSQAQPSHSAFCSTLREPPFPHPETTKHSQLPAEYYTCKHLFLSWRDLPSSAPHFQQQVGKAMDLHPLLSDRCKPKPKSSTPTVIPATLLSLRCLKTSGISSGLQWVQLCGKSLGTSALHPCCFPHLPLNLMWE